MTLRQILLAWEQEQAAERRARRARITDNNAAFIGGPPAQRLQKDLE
ncbi:hypothetical protein KWH04_01175 [Xanthomonas campestris pv. trichodesmae]|nr:hypothetical protein [Xanthomonas citri]MBV6779282.1 hypothetical protein [Xanthomonas campestris pv. trichodesmae]